MTCFIFVRHGASDDTGKVLSGRQSGITLNAQGRAQVDSLPQRLSPLRPDLVCSSPLERCQQTAQVIARAFDLELRLLPGLLELDYGDWQGRSLSQLAEDPYWAHYNRFRSTSRIPAGELLVEAQVRMLHVLDALHRELPKATVALVGHGDPIRATLAYLLGIPLDLINRLVIAPASVSVATVGPGEPRVHIINSSAPIGSGLFD